MCARATRMGRTVSGRDVLRERGLDLVAHRGEESGKVACELVAHDLDVVGLRENFSRGILVNLRKLSIYSLVLI